MAVTNHIMIARGTTTPSTSALANDGELGYDKTNKKLYINNAGSIQQIGAATNGSTTQFLRGDGTWATVSTTDTKNTAGTTNSTSKLFLAGATTQAANPQTYSNSNVYATNGTLHASTMEGKCTIIAGSSAPTNTTHDFWIDTSETGSVPAAYGVANNLTTSSAGSYVLDAYQGKLLQDQINNLSSYDYVIAKSRNGDWYYRKWKNGDLDIWTRKLLVSGKTDFDLGNLCEATAIQCCVASGFADDSYRRFAHVNWNTSNTIINVYIDYQSSSGGAVTPGGSGYVSVIAYGKWK